MDDLRLLMKSNVNHSKMQGPYGQQTRVIRTLDKITPLRILYLITLVIAIVIAGYMLNRPSQPVIDHCNSNSEIFEAIQTHASEWTQFFPKMPVPSATKSLMFTTADGSQYPVFAEYWTTESQAPIFYIPTEEDGIGFASTPLGKSGLFFTPTGELPVKGIDQVIPIEGNTYCYEIR